MRAGFSDPQGPKKWRVVPYALPILMALFAMFGPLHGTPAGMLGLASVAVFHLIGYFGMRQRQLRNAEIECNPGYVEIKQTGSRNQKIHTKDIIGATTARSPAGTTLTLQHRKRDQPITLELANDADCEKVRHALGIGHGGFGRIAWRTHADGMARAAFAGRTIVLTIVFITALVAAFGSTDTAILVGALLAQFGAVGAALGLAGLFAKSSDASIVMEASGLKLKTPGGWFALPYEGVREVVDHARGFVFSVPQPYNSVAVARVSPLLGGMSPHERSTVIAQIMSAALRARGLGPQKTDVTGRVDVLRRNGESPRDWLVRLDMAGQMLNAGPGYRGNTLDKEDLWAILEDPEADTDLRAAAARVLRHAPEPEARVRIDAAVAAVRDDDANKRLRVAVSDDLDAASQELTQLDAADQARQWQMQRPPMYGGR